MTFPFLRLPLLVKNEVIRSMGHEDCINLVLASKIASQTVRMARIKKSYASINISPTAHIELWDEKVVLFPIQEGKIEKEAEVIKPEVLKKWISQSSNSIVENTAKVYNEMKNIFRFKERLFLIFSSDYKKVTTVKEVISNPILQNWDVCHFEDETIESEDLKMIMDRASPHVSFFSVAECPIDFRHEKAFNFSNSHYEDARWVRLEDLYKLYECYTVTLGRNSLTQTDIKTFIKYWVNNTIDMFYRMEIRTIELLDLTEIFDELTLLHIQHDMGCFTKVKSTTRREQTLLYFLNTQDCLKLAAWPPGEFVSETGDHEFDRAINNNHGVIDLLMEKKQLEMEWESTDEENKRIISHRLRQLVDEIQGPGVFFNDGKATLRVPMQ